MPPGNDKRIHKVNELERLRLECDKKQKEIDRLTAQQKAKDKEVDKRIAKPPGQAGRRDGFILKKAMGLEDEHINRLKRLIKSYADEHLDITKTIRHQDKEKYMICMRAVTRVAPVLGKYRSRWPVYAILKQYLGTHSRTRAKDIAAEEEEEGQPDRVAIRAYHKTLGGSQVKERPSTMESEDEEMSEEESMKKAAPKSKKTSNRRHGKRAVINDDSGAEGDSEIGTTSVKQVYKISDAKNYETSDKDESTTTDTDIDNALKLASNEKVTKISPDIRPEPQKHKETRKAKVTQTMKKRIKKGKAANKENIIASAPSKAATTIKPRVKKPEANNRRDLDLNGKGTSSIKRKRSMEILDDYVIKKKKKVQTDEADAQESGNDLGQACPDSSCNDEVPLPLNPQLEDMFSRFKVMKKTFKETRENPKGFGMLKMAIHMRMAAEIDAPRLKAIAHDRAWPLEIDFMAVPRRVQAMKDEVIGFVENDIVLQCSSMWRIVVDVLIRNTVSLARFKSLPPLSKFKLLAPNVHAGYYGPLGVTIIKSTIYSILQPKRAILESTLMDIIAAQAAKTASEDAALWKAADGSCLSYFDVVDFIIQPHVVNHLIMADLKIDEKDAQDIRLESYEYGLEFNKENDEFADGVLGNIRGSTIEDPKSPPCFRQTGSQANGSCEMNASPGPGPSTMAIRAAAAATKPKTKAKPKVKPITLKNYPTPVIDVRRSGRQKPARSYVDPDETDVC